MIRSTLPWCSMLLLPVVAEAQPAPRTTEPQRYTVHSGDTCVAIARRVYGDRRLTVLIHRANPDLGPPPHRLQPGRVLILPPRPTTGEVPDATLTALQNRVEVSAPSPRPAHRNDPLFRGNRVTTEERSLAEVTFADETQLRLEERTLIVILGDSSQRVDRSASARDTTLERGTLTAFLAGLDQQRRGMATPPTPSLNTAAGRVAITHGTEARIEVDAQRRTTLAVYRGASQIAQRRQRVAVREGYGVRAERGRPIPPPRRLPLAPTWTLRPPRLVWLTTPNTTLTGEYGAGSAPATVAPGETIPAAAEWRVVVARDERFNDVVADIRAPAVRTRVEVPNIEAGSYFIRVFAIDGEGFQGPASEVAPVMVSRVELTPTNEAPHRASITVAQGLFCGLDGASLTAVTGAIPVDRSEAHTLRCAINASGEGTVEYPLPADPIVPLHIDAALASSDAARYNGEVRLLVRDAAGAPLTRDRVTVTTTTTAVTLGEVRRGDEAGVYLLAATWPADARTLALRFDVDGTSTDLAPITLPEAPVVAAPAPDTFVHRLSLRVEAGGAYVLSDLQRNNDPMRFNGVTPALAWGLGGQVLAGLQLLHPEGGYRGSALALQLGGGYWYLPSEQPGKFVDIALAGGGLRAEPFSGCTRFFVDAHGYLSLSGGLVRSAFDVGLGIDFALGPSVLLGPYARYQQVIEFGGALTDDDARLVTAGVAISLRPASARW